MQLFLWRLGLAAGETDRSSGFGQIREERNTLIEDKAFSVPVRSTNLFKIANNASFELLDVGESSILHDDTGLFASHALSLIHI